MMSKYILTSLPEDLQLLYGQLDALEKAGITDVVFAFEKDADYQRALNMLKGQ